MPAQKITSVLTPETDGEKNVRSFVRSMPLVMAPSFTVVPESLGYQKTERKVFFFLTVRLSRGSRAKSCRCFTRSHAVRNA